MTASPAAMPQRLDPAALLASLPALHRPDPQLSSGYWMTTCQHCSTPIPRHLSVCRQHEEAT